MRSYKFCHNRYKFGYTCTAFAFTGYHSVSTSQDKSISMWIRYEYNQ